MAFNTNLYQYWPKKLFNCVGPSPKQVRGLLLPGILTSWLVYWFVGLKILVLVLMSTLISIIFLHNYQRQRKILRFQKQFESFLTALINSLKSGHSLMRGLEVTAHSLPKPISTEVQLLLHRIRLGESLEQALVHMKSTYPIPELNVFIQAVHIAQRYGANLSRLLCTIQISVQTRNRFREKLLSITAQGRAQAWVSIALPFGFTAIMLWISPNHLSPLFATTAGNIALAASAAMLLIGALWIRHIARQDLIS